MAEPYVNPAELPVKRRENIALGVLGALLFSAAGGLVHFGLLQLGYIAWISALVGMAAGYFGYGLFSGRKNTVHGAILAVVFTMLMIVAAEYFGLAKEIFDAFKETYDIAFRDALASVPDFLTEAEIRTSVLKDLGIAFVFSILEAVFFIRDAVRKSKAAAAAEILLTGNGASRGAGQGKVRFLRSALELNRVGKGEILAAERTDPDMVPGMRVASAILADVGGDVAMKLVDALRDRVQEKGLKTGEQAADALRDIIADEMRPETEMALDGHPAVILVIGVNGVGKTTSIAKLADYYTRQGKKVMLAAGDTFRAAASEQLEIWAGRAGVPIVKAGEGADPAAVIFDTVKSATARGYDMVIADTAGRLHNKSNLMSELSKISRSVRKAAPEASLETLLVLDAITGQNAISQAKEFCKAADATGIILTKLDGTAKGGCVVAVKQRLGLPVRFIGVGEGIDDLIPFTPEGFVEELIPRTGWKH